MPLHDHLSLILTFPKLVELVHLLFQTLQAEAKFHDYGNRQIFIVQQMSISIQYVYSVTSDSGASNLWIDFSTKDTELVSLYGSDLNSFIEKILLSKVIAHLKIIHQ